MKKALVFIAILALSTASAEASLNYDLKYGYSGIQVTELQEYLIDQGYLSYSATGFFGPLTLSAVRNYQSVKGLPSTGFVGPLTRSEINKDLQSYATGADQAELEETGSVSQPEDDVKTEVKKIQKKLDDSAAENTKLKSDIEEIKKNTSKTGTNESTPVFSFGDIQVAEGEKTFHEDGSVEMRGAGDIMLPVEVTGTYTRLVVSVTKDGNTGSREFTPSTSKRFIKFSQEEKGEYQWKATIYNGDKSYKQSGTVTVE